jgi:predicted  nucleic acid-binding Zn-ribbon protein
MNVKNSREFEALNKEIELANLEILTAERKIKQFEEFIAEKEERVAEVKAVYDDRARDPDRCASRRPAHHRRARIR